jgi:hypothetical protein
MSYKDITLNVSMTIKVSPSTWDGKLKEMKGKGRKIGLGWVTILQFYAMLPIHISLFGAPLKRHIQIACAPSMACFQ